MKDKLVKKRKCWKKCKVVKALRSYIKELEYDLSGFEKSEVQKFIERNQPCR